MFSAAQHRPAARNRDRNRNPTWVVVEAVTDRADFDFDGDTDFRERDASA